MVSSVSFFKKDNPRFNYKHEVSTDSSGFYEFEPNNGKVNLDKGTYIAFSNATAQIYRGKLNATKELIVEARPPSVPQEIWYSLFGIVVGFLIPSIVSWSISWVQRRSLRRYRESIDSTYYSYEESFTRREDCLDTLDKIEKEITEQLKKGRINQSQYEMLMKRISEFKNNIEH